MANGNGRHFTSDDDRYDVQRPPATCQARFHRIGQSMHVQRGEQDSTGPAGGQHKPATFPRSHPLVETSEMKKRKYCQGQLEGQHILAEVQQAVDPAVAKFTHYNCQWSLTPKTDTGPRSRLNEQPRKLNVGSLGAGFVGITVGKCFDAIRFAEAETLPHQSVHVRLGAGP